MKKFFAWYYDYFMNPLEKKLITNWRKELLTHAKGKVLEIGAGTGINFPLYKTCEEVVAIEPNPHMIEKSKERVKQATVPISLTEASAENLPFPDAYFDTIVVTLVLCSVEEPEQVISELKRVLKKEGQLLFLEHVEMEQMFPRTLQKLLTPFWRHVCDGCHLNRKTEQIIRTSGLKIILKKSYLSGFALSLITEKE